MTDVGSSTSLLYSQEVILAEPISCPAFLPAIGGTDSSSSSRGWFERALYCRENKIISQLLIDNRTTSLQERGLDITEKKKKKRTCVVDLAGAGVNSLEKLIHLLIRHFLAQICEDIFELANTDKARHILIEDLETTAVLLGVAGVAEAAWSVENALEGLEVDCWEKRGTLSVSVLRSKVAANGCSGSLTVTTNVLLKVADLGESRVLAACAQ